MPDLKELLQEYSAITVDQKIYKSMMLDFLGQHDDAFDRSCRLGHFTASAIVISRTGDEILMMNHKKLNKWLQLGGHCDGDHDLLAVAIQEAKEESGLADFRVINTSIFDCEVHLIPKDRQEAPHYHYDVRFLLQANENEPLVGNQESKDLKWISLRDAAYYNSEKNMLRLYEKIKSTVRMHNLFLETI
jgi:ADP-ribose pyrophosphatase YjhB (NUDIX family)